MSSNLSRHKRHLGALSLLLTAAVLIRFLYYYQSTLIIISDDTYGYLEVARSIAATGNIFSPVRTPLYPLFLVIVFNFYHALAAPLFSSAFNQAASAVIWLQNLGGLISIVLFYLIGLKLFNSRKLTFILSLLFSLNILLFGWERQLLTESLNLLLLLFFTFYAICFREQPAARKIPVLLILFILLFLLKPIYLFFPAFITLYFIFVKKLMPYRTGLIISCLLLYLLVGFYIWRNYTVYQFSGINYVSGINLTGKALQYRISAKNVQGYDELKTAYEQSLANYETTPWKIIQHTQKFSDRYNLRQFSGFSIQIISQNVLLFIGKTLFLLPGALLDLSDKIYPGGHNPASQFLLGHLLLFFTSLRFLNLLLIPVFFLNLYVFRGGKNKHPAGNILGLICLYQIMFSVAFSYDEYGRLLTPLIPQIWLLLVLSLLKLLKLPKLLK